jgi:hypothetical protein
MHGGPPIAAMVLRKVYPLSVTLTGALTFPKTLLGSKVKGMKHIDPSRTIVVLNDFDGLGIALPQP